MASDSTPPELRYDLPRSPLTMMAPALAGGTVGFLLVSRNTGESAIDTIFAALPEIHLWRLLIAAQFSYFVGVLPAVDLRLRHVVQQGPSAADLGRIVAGVVFALVAFFSPALMARMPARGVTVLDGRVPWVPIAAAGVVTVSCLGLMLIYLNFHRLRETGIAHQLPPLVCRHGPGLRRVLHGPAGNRLHTGTHRGTGRRQGCLQCYGCCEARQ